VCSSDLTAFARYHENCGSSESGSQSTTLPGEDTVPLSTAGCDRPDREQEATTLDGLIRAALFVIAKADAF